MKVTVGQQRVSPAGYRGGTGAVRANAAAFGGAMGDAGMMLGRAIEGSGARIAGAVDSIGLRREATRMLENLSAMQDEYRRFDTDYRAARHGRDAETALADYTAKVDELNARYRQGISDGRVLYDWDAKVSSFRSGALASAADYGRTQDEAWRKDTLNARKERMLTTAADPDTSLEAANAAFAETQKEIAALYPGPIESILVENQEAFDKVMIDRSVSAVNAKIESGNFAEASRLLNDPFLPIEKKMALELKIDREVSRRLALQESEMKAQRAVVEKDMYAKSSDKTLTRADVESARDILTPEDYFKALALLEGKTSLPDKSDPEALILLQRMAVDGDASLRDTADDFLRAGRLTNGDYSRMLNEYQQWSKPVIRQADEVLKLKTGYSERTPNPDAGNSYLMARDDFQTWLDSAEGQKAGDEEKIRMANRIGDNYRIAQVESILSVPVPLLLVGSRTMPDIKATIAATNKAYYDGRMTETEYAEQARRIKRMADILERRTRETRATQESRR